jgi:hypothetical protein
VRRALFLAVAVAVLGAPLGWWASDQLEQNDAFCTSCHLPSGEPLHADKAADFSSRPAVSLAVAHAVAGNRAHPDGAFRCIDCHGGTDLAGRARVKALSLRDAAIYLTGRFEEPRGMDWPLRDEDCRRCHASFRSSSEAAESGGTPRFHALPVHNRKLGVTCVTCHLAHERGGLAELNFLHPAPVRAECVRCHPELGEGSP